MPKPYRYGDRFRMRLLSFAILASYVTHPVTEARKGPQLSHWRGFPDCNHPRLQGATPSNPHNIKASGPLDSDATRNHGYNPAPEGANGANATGLQVPGGGTRASARFDTEQMFSEHRFSEHRFSEQMFSEQTFSARLTRAPLNKCSVPAGIDNATQDANATDNATQQG